MFSYEKIIKSKLSKSILLICALLCLNSNTFGLVNESECGPTDVRDGMNPEMREHFTTPRDQSSIGWCHAFTASDLLSVELGRPVSSTHVAANANQAIRRNPAMRGYFLIANTLGRTPTNDSIGVREGGHIRQTIQYNMDQGFLCSEEGLPFNSDIETGTVSHIQFLEELSSFITEHQGGPINLAECSGFIMQQSVNPFLSGNLESLQSIASELASNHIDESFANIVSISCPIEHRIPVRENRVRKRNTPTQGQGPEKERAVNRWLSELNGVLNSGRPLGLEYNAGSLLVKGDGERLSHSSVIVARKWENGKCLFKVRNSWGQSCAQYDSTVIAECDEREGAFWIDDQKLLDISSNINFIGGS